MKREVKGLGFMLIAHGNKAPTRPEASVNRAETLLSLRAKTLCFILFLNNIKIYIKKRLKMKHVKS